LRPVRGKGSLRPAALRLPGLQANLDLAVKKAHEFSKNVIWSSVWEHDSSILHFYNQFGFKTIEKQPFTLAGQAEHDLVMEVAV